MINLNEVFETNKMIHEMNLDVRTITIGISLLDCVGATLEEVKENIYNKITTVAKDLVKTGKISRMNLVFQSLTSEFLSHQFL